MLLANLTKILFHKSSCQNSLSTFPFAWLILPWNRWKIRTKVCQYALIQKIVISGVDVFRSVFCLQFGFHSLNVFCNDKCEERFYLRYLKGSQNASKIGLFLWCNPASQLSVSTVCRDCFTRYSVAKPTISIAFKKFCKFFCKNNHWYLRKDFCIKKKNSFWTI